MDNMLNADQQLQELYGQPLDIVVEAWGPQLEETAISYIKNAPLMLLSSVNESGFVDISLRGGLPGFIAIPDDKHIAFLDQPGNKKLHSLHNLLNNPKVGLMFMIPGVKEILRAHGIAELSHDQEQIEKMGGEPGKNKTLVTIQIEKVFPHCPKALNFAQLGDSSAWLDAKVAGVPGLLDMAKGMAASRGEKGH